MTAPDARPPAAARPGPGRPGILLLWLAVAFAYFTPGRIAPARVAEPGLPRHLERVADANALVALAGSPGGDVWVVTRERVTRYPGGDPADPELSLDPAGYRERFGRHLDPFTAGHVDGRGALWVGTRRGELLVHEHGAWMERSNRFGGPTDPVRAIAARADFVGVGGRGLWRGARGGGALARDPRFGRARIDHVVAGDALGVAIATAGEVWLAAPGSARWSRVWSSGADDGAIGALAAGPDGELWIGARSGLVRIGRDGELRRELTGLAVVALAHGPDVALAGTRGAGLHARFAGDWRRVEGTGGAETSRVSALATAPGGAFWVVRGRGLYRAVAARPSGRG